MPAAHTSLILAPLGSMYGVVTRARLALYHKGFLKTHRIPAPVISVGNITAGGTGKTPLVAWLARVVAEDLGRRVCVLTRGYGRVDARRRVVVSDGGQIFADAREGGDEPRLLAETLLVAGVAVVSDADRVSASRWALENLRSEVFILDDGFQHLRVARDLNVVTLDGADPWGGGRLLPRGRLREPVRELKRADAIVITRADLAPDIESLRAEATRLGGGRARVFTSRVTTRRVLPLQTQSANADGSQNSHANSEPADSRSRVVASGEPQTVVTFPQPVAAFCALGNPQAFFAHLRGDGHAVAYTRAFADHHEYTQADVDDLAREAARRGARSLLTTAKDAVKLRALKFPLACYVVEIGLEFEDERGLRGIVGAAVRRAGGV